MDLEGLFINNLQAKIVEQENDEFEKSSSFNPYSILEDHVVKRNKIGFRNKLNFGKEQASKIGFRNNLNVGKEESSEVTCTDEDKSFKRDNRKSIQQKDMNKKKVLISMESQQKIKESRTLLKSGRRGKIGIDSKLYENRKPADQKILVPEVTKIEAEVSHKSKVEDQKKVGKGKLFTEEKTKRKKIRKTCDGSIFKSSNFSLHSRDSLSRQENKTACPHVLPITGGMAYGAPNLNPDIGKLACSIFSRILVNI